MIAEDRDALLEALATCKATLETRNTLVHGSKTASLGADGRFQTVRSRRHTDVPVYMDWTPTAITEAARVMGIEAVWPHGAGFRDSAHGAFV